MDIRVAIYERLPAFVKQGLTAIYIRRRHWLEKREVAARQKMEPTDDEAIRVVYLSGFPRSGTTLLKYYFGTYPGLRQSEFTPKGFFEAWERSRELSGILVDKSNHYLYSIKNLFAAYGRAVRLCIVVRDPRDCLVSFARYQENREVPRDRSFWPYWSRQHADLVKFAEDSDFGDCLSIVRYEDLVRFPEEAKAHFLNWLGFDASPGALDRRYVNEHPGEGWHDSVNEHHTVNDRALQKWKQFSEADLPSWTAELLPQWRNDPESREMMRLFGYHENGFGDAAWDHENVNLFRPERVAEPV